MSQRAAAFAPGRVNLIGEHTDYNQGLALPFAIEAGVTVRAERRAGEQVLARAVDLGQEDRFPLGEPGPADGWAAFVHGAVGELAEQGVELPAAELEISGTVPQGGGLSSSAALEVALVLALLALADVPRPPAPDLARTCARIENRWAGAQTGLLDQLASLCGERDRALRIDFASLELAPVPLRLQGFRLVTLDSGEQHANAASGYNERRSECEEAARRLGLESLRQATAEMADELPAPLDRRVRHVVGENERVERTVSALEEGDLPAVGELLDASHASLRDLYEVSTAKVEAAVDRLRGCGALGARIMGGGFGGHVLGLLPAAATAPEGVVEVRPGEGAHIIV